MQGDHVIAGGGEHSPHLVIAALVNCQAGASLTQKVEDGGGQGFVLALQRQLARSEQRAFGAAKIAARGSRDSVLATWRRGEITRCSRCAVIGDEDQAGGVGVQAADGGKRRGAPSPPLGQELIDAAPGLVMRTDDAERLVEDQGQRRGRVECRAGHRHPLRQISGRDHVRRRRPSAAPPSSITSPAGDQGLDLSPRPISEIGEQPVEADAHPTASSTL